MAGSKPRGHMPLRSSKLNTPALLSIIGLLAAFGMIAVMRLSASSSTLYLAPASRSLSANQTFDVEIHENSGGEPINTVQANLEYPADKLDFVSIDPSPSFPVPGPSRGGGGVVSIASATSGGTSLVGDQLIASIKFKTKNIAGPVSINFADGSEIFSSNSHNDIVYGTTGANYTINSSAGAPAPNPQASTVEPSAATSSGSATLKITILDANGHPIRGAQVGIGSTSAITDKAGLATVSNLVPGRHTVTMKTGSQSQTKTITIKPSSSSPQAVTMSFLAYEPGPSAVQLLLVLTALIVMFVLCGLFMSRLRRRFSYPDPQVKKTQIAVRPKFGLAETKPAKPAFHIHHTLLRGEHRFNALLAVVIVGTIASVGILVKFQSATNTTISYLVPSSIPADCSRSVSAELMEFIDTVPDGSSIDFAPNGCYGQNEPINITNRYNLAFNGQGSIFKDLTVSNDCRAAWIIRSDSSIELKNMTVQVITTSDSPPTTQKTC